LIDRCRWDWKLEGGGGEVLDEVGERSLLIGRELRRRGRDSLSWMLRGKDGRHADEKGMMI
jgi:hypothetical protein